MEGEKKLLRKGGWWVSLGDGIDSIDNSRNVAKNGEQQTDPELYLWYGICRDGSKKWIRERKKEENRECMSRYIYTLQPCLRKTPRGGRMMARRISMQVAVLPSAIFSYPFELFLSKESRNFVLFRLLKKT